MEHRHTVMWQFHKFNTDLSFQQQCEMIVAIWREPDAATLAECILKSDPYYLDYLKARQYLEKL